MIASALLSLLFSLVVPGLDDADVTAALAGSVPVHADSSVDASGFASGRGQGAILIWRPIADVWSTLSHYEDRAEYIPRVKKVVVLDKTPTRVRVWQEIDATVTTARYTAIFDLDEKAHAIRWTMDTTAKDNTLRSVDGDYAMIAVDAGRTLLVYHSTVNAGMHVPRSIQTYMTKKSLPDLLQNIKKRVESGGTWKR